MEDPRDGLTLFGPLDEGKPYGIRAGIIGTQNGIRRMKRWIERIQSPIYNQPARMARPPFPGFDAVFRIAWNPEPHIEIAVPQNELNDAVHLDDKHQRVFRTVDVYARRIIEAIKEEESSVDLWFVVIPEKVYRYCRPKSVVEADQRLEAESKMPANVARRTQIQPLLDPQGNIDALPYHYEVDFHNQLKARLLEYRTPIQIIREIKIAYTDFLNRRGRPVLNLEAMESAIAWNISTAVFYKAGGRPWKIGTIRDGVCYIGLVFKQDLTNPDPRSACCAAQMFLDSGDGVVFKGAVGPWHTTGRGDFHLSRHAAREVVRLAMKTYMRNKGAAPRELFLHGKVRFNDEEWIGFQEAVDSATTLVGVRIRPDGDLKLYKQTDSAALRGLAYVRDQKTAYLWTKGYTPRLRTYPGREVPNPLLIDVCRGRADIEIVLNDIMALTKLNYNACLFADGVPVTLKFADAVGEILTAGPVKDVPPLPFKHYI
jgi:hypothetical protein